MKPKKLTPLLYTQKLDETIGFYTEILGFTCGDRNDEWGWASLHNSEVEIMLAKPNEHTPFDRPVFTGSFYFNVQDVDAAWEELKSKTNVVYPIDDFDWGMREFAIYDNNGYVLQFGEEIS